MSFPYDPSRTCNPFRMDCRADRSMPSHTRLWDRLKGLTHDSVADNIIFRFFIRFLLGILRMLE